MRWTRTRFAALGLVMVTALGACSAGGEDDQTSAAAPTEADSAPAPDVGEPDEGTDAEDAQAEDGEDAEAGAEGDALDEHDVPQGPWDHGEFVAYTMDGAEMALTLPAKESPAGVEEHRENVGEAPVEYLKVVVDNTNSPEYLDLSEVVVLDENGDEHAYTYLSGVIDGWEQNDDSLELSLGFDSVTAPGEETTVWFAGPDEMPEKIGEVQVFSEAGMDSTYAFPATGL